MKETKVYPQSEADQDFAKLLKNIRTEENVSLDQLAMGLMSASQLVKIENGERPINKNIRSRSGFCKITKEYKNRRKCIIRPVSDGINECQPACEN